MSESLRVSTLARAPDLCLCAVLYHVSAQPSSQANSAKLIFCTSTRLPRGPLTAASRTVLAVSGFTLRLPHYRRAAQPAPRLQGSLLHVAHPPVPFAWPRNTWHHRSACCRRCVAPGALSFWPVADSVRHPCCRPSGCGRSQVCCAEHQRGLADIPAEPPTGGVQRYLRAQHPACKMPNLTQGGRFIPPSLPPLAVPLVPSLSDSICRPSVDFSAALRNDCGLCLDIPSSLHIA